MHEISLCESILEIMREKAETEAFERVRGVSLEIGALSCAEPEAMRFAFDAVMKDTLAAGARFEIVRVPGRARCLSCLHDVTIEQYGELCPDCGGSRLEISDGDQLRIRELEVI